VAASKSLPTWPRLPIHLSCFRILTMGRNLEGRTADFSNHTLKISTVEAPTCSSSASARYFSRSKPRQLASITANPPMKNPEPWVFHTAKSVLPDAQRSASFSSYSRLKVSGIWPSCVIPLLYCRSQPYRNPPRPKRLAELLIPPGQTRAAAEAGAVLIQPVGLDLIPVPHDRRRPAGRT
jgi:hypothetical protein